MSGWKYSRALAPARPWPPRTDSSSAGGRGPRVRVLGAFSPVFPVAGAPRVECPRSARDSATAHSESSNWKFAAQNEASPGCFWHACPTRWRRPNGSSVCPRRGISASVRLSPFPVSRCVFFSFRKKKEALLVRSAVDGHSKRAAGSVLKMDRVG